MIFRIKHHWYWALAATAIVGLIAWQFGAWETFGQGRFSVPLQLLIGVAGALTAMIINASLHEVFKPALGQRYQRAFQVYSSEVLGPMRWPEYVASGLMAGLAEEPVFRGLVLSALLSGINPLDLGLVGIAAAILITALVFAGCHWLRIKYFGFWLWAAWEGLLQGILMVWTGSLLVPVVAHGLHDVLAYAAFGVMSKKEGWRK